MAYLREERCFNRIKATDFDEGERTAILMRIQDDAAWKAMPLHKDTEGNFGPITASCFIDPDGIAVPGLADGVRVRIFKLSDTAKLSEDQKKWIPHWTHETTICQALAQANLKLEFLLSGYRQISSK